ncbi:amino acid transporter-like protein [Lindgomyces ingoldianus]|uniref:Amino acid transporter-like protein n=1 Tax=Lindgomyces ingoldianus TaxID=673940 RepID=A0ACB6R3P7_9PLEO|nr:amino acid transporter-like protein [Lindgomyces ingoldianus]KAF2473687.1 amino acid transporter-like protein [Lindgomyces ingoldianus]
MAPSETSPLLASEGTPAVATDTNQQDVHPEIRGTFARQLSALDGFALLISIVIGSGIFSSPGPIDANVPSPGAALLIWLVGGLLAWTGALTMAELGTAFPGEGGIQPYLSHIYGEVFGFLAAWSWIVAVMPATLAILSIVFVESIYSSMGVNDAAPPITHKIFSLLILVVVSTANSISTKTSTRLGGFFVAVKLLSIFLLIVAGLTVVFVYLGNNGKDFGGGDWHSRGWFAPRDTVLPNGSKFDWTQATSWQMLGFYCTALYGALWAYSGWDKANYVAAELKNPSKQLPLSINTAIPTIIICYVAANAAYYVLLPWKVISITDAAAVTAVTHFLGKGAAYIAAVLICLVVAGSALGNSFVVGRMTVAAANKKWLPHFLGTVGQIGRWRVSKGAGGDGSDEAMDKGESPMKVPPTFNALVLSTILSAVYILVGNMRVLLTFNGLGEYSFFFLTVLGAIILRWREPDLHRPVKPFILIPAIFAIISGFVVIRGAIFAPVQASILVGIWAVGLIFFYARKRALRS